MSPAEKLPCLVFRSSCQELDDFGFYSFDLIEDTALLVSSRRSASARGFACAAPPFDGAPRQSSEEKRGFFESSIALASAGRLPSALVGGAAAGASVGGAGLGAAGASVGGADAALAGAALGSIASKWCSQASEVVVSRHATSTFRLFVCSAPDRLPTQRRPTLTQRDGHRTRIACDQNVPRVPLH